MVNTEYLNSCRTRAIYCSYSAGNYCQLRVLIFWRAMPLRCNARSNFVQICLLYSKILPKRHSSSIYLIKANLECFCLARFVLIFTAAFQRASKNAIFVNFFGGRKPNNPKLFFRVPELKSKANQTSPMFQGVTFDSVELQKWSCNLKNLSLFARS